MRARDGFGEGAGRHSDTRIMKEDHTELAQKLMPPHECYLCSLLCLYIKKSINSSPERERKNFCLREPCEGIVAVFCFCQSSKQRIKSELQGVGFAFVTPAGMESKWDKTVSC